MIKVVKDIELNKVSFFLNGNKVFPVSVSGNIYTFENGQNIIL